jgi:gliding motility-associated lipoprotein GldH
MRLYELPILYLDKLNLPQGGDYEVVIQQGMREDTLPGIVDVGLKIMKIE